MAIIHTYSPADVDLIINGYVVPDFTSLSVTLNEETYKIVKGIGGIVTRTKTSDTSATISIDILQTSIANDVLNQVWMLDRKTGNGRLSVTVKDRSGSTLIQSTQGFIQSPKERKFTDTFNDQAWNIILLSTDESFMIGGNFKAAEDVMART